MHLSYDFAVKSLFFNPQKLFFWRLANIFDKFQTQNKFWRMTYGLELFQIVKVKGALVVFTSGSDQQTRFRSYKHLLMSFSTFFIAPEWLSRNRPRERHNEKISSGLIFGSIIKWTVKVKMNRFEILPRIVTFSNPESSYRLNLDGILKWGLLLKDWRVHLIGQSNLNR